MKKFRMSLFVCSMFLCILGAAADAATVDVSIGDSFFFPQTVTVNVGDTVRWTNNGFIIHTSTSGTSCLTTNGQWDSGILLHGQSFPFTFTQAGTFSYVCTIHCFTGTVIVDAAQSTIPVPTTFQTFSYPAIVAPVLSSTPTQAQPVGLGSVATGGGILSIEVAFNQFAGPVDVYFLLLIPAIDPINIYQLTSLGTFQTLSAGLSPWMTNATGPISQGLFGDIPTVMLPRGSFYFGAFVTPVGDQSLTKGYLWITSFTL